MPAKKRKEMPRFLTPSEMFFLSFRYIHLVVQVAASERTMLLDTCLLGRKALWKYWTEQQ